MDKLISVIIPCYNVEKYVFKCLDSVLSQTYSNLEIIVIDDGSTDNTANILNRYAADERIKLITQKNAGVSAARNAGIDCASGELVAFVDSDDWIEPGMYQGLYTALIENNADMAVCDFNIVYADGRVDTGYSHMRNGTVEIYDDVYGYFCKYCACPAPNNYIWTRLYKMDIIKKSGVYFENYRLGDDTLFNFKLLPHIQRVSFIEQSYYNYFQRTNSNVYTVAGTTNLATIYADTFDALADYYKKMDFNAFFSVLPIHAFTRMRSVFFYSRLAGMDEQSIVKSIMDGFKDRGIADYLTGVEK